MLPEISPDMQDLIPGQNVEREYKDIIHLLKKSVRIQRVVLGH